MENLKERISIIKAVNLLKIISFLCENIKNSILLKLENLNIIEFLSTYPFLLFKKNQIEYSELLFHGFPKKSIEYQNIEVIFKNNYVRTIRSIQYLISKGLIDEIVFGENKIYEITKLGEEICKELQSDYSKSYKVSISYIFSRIKDMDTLNLRNLCEYCVRENQVKEIQYKIFLKTLSICFIGFRCYIEGKIDCNNCEFGKKIKQYIESGILSLE